MKCSWQPGCTKQIRQERSEGWFCDDHNEVLKEERLTATEGSIRVRNLRVMVTGFLATLDMAAAKVHGYGWFRPSDDVDLSDAPGRLSPSEIGGSPPPISSKLDLEIASEQVRRLQRGFLNLGIPREVIVAVALEEADAEVQLRAALLAQREKLREGNDGS